MVEPATHPPTGEPARDRLRRTMLLTPGNQATRLAKATRLDVDAVVFDLEDGVPPGAKADARKIVAEALATLEFGHRERLVRVNAIGTPEYEADLGSLVLDRIDAVFVPKVERASQLEALDAYLGHAETTVGRSRKIDIVATIETPRGLLNALEIADATSRTSALFFGSGDYCAATGAKVTARALEFPRANIVAAAAAAGLQAIDAAYFTDVKDEAATRADAVIGRELGFDGKVIFHPAQIGPCNTIFSPCPGEIAHARKIVQAHCEAVDAGRGVAYVDDTFLAIDIVLMAKRVLAKADLISAHESRDRVPGQGV